MGWGCAGTLSPLCLNSHLAQASTWPVRWAEAEPWRENAHVGQSEEEHGLRTGPGVSITAGRGRSRGARKGLRTSRRVWNTVGEGAALQRGWAGAHKGALRRPGAELCSSASVRWGSLQCKGRAVSGDSCQQTRDSTQGALGGSRSSDGQTGEAWGSQGFLSGDERERGMCSFWQHIH